MFRARVRFVLVVIGLLAAVPASGQVITDGRIWTGVGFQGRLAERSPWRWSLESQVRTRDGVHAVDVFLIRFWLGRDLTSRSNVGGGYTNSTTFPVIGEPLTEHRAFQQVVWTGRPGTASIAFRTRFEERFSEGNNEAAYRLRQQVRYTRPFTGHPRFALVAYEEVFVHTNETNRYGRGFDQNRVFGGVARTITPRVRLELGYLNQFINSRVGSDRMNHILYAVANTTF
jgi:Protein of unknown function (DUF2490)